MNISYKLVLSCTSHSSYLEALVVASATGSSLIEPSDMDENSSSCGGVTFG